MTGAVLITGCNGGIGAAMTAAFADAGWMVVGVDITEAKAGGKFEFVRADIGDACRTENGITSIAGEIRKALNGRPLKALVNNAAVQILGGAAELTADEFTRTMEVNTVAPFMLVKAFLADLQASEGVVINIGSVHARATKPGFVAYATSKAALHGLTRALAVDLGPNVRVNTLAPAATATTMLKAGFAGNPEGFAALEKAHPVERIAQPEEIAKMAVFLASKEASFLSGATIYADGGVLSRLHDPA